MNSSQEEEVSEVQSQGWQKEQKSNSKSKIMSANSQDLIS